MDGEDDIPSLFGVNGMFNKDSRYTKYRSNEREVTPSLEISKKLDNILTLDEDTQPISFSDDNDDLSFLNIDDVEELNKEKNLNDDASIASRTRSKISLLSDKAITPSKKRINAPFSSMTFNAHVTKNPFNSSVGGSHSPFSFNSSSKSTITGLSKSASMITPRAQSVFNQSTSSTLTFRSLASGTSTNLKSPFTKQFSTLNNSTLSSSFNAPSETSVMIENKRKRKMNILIIFMLISLITLSLFIYSYYQVLQLQAEISEIKTTNQHHLYNDDSINEDDAKFFTESIPSTINSKYEMKYVEENDKVDNIHDDYI